MAVSKQFGVLRPVNHYSYIRASQMAELSQTQVKLLYVGGMVGKKVACTNRWWWWLLWLWLPPQHPSRSSCPWQSSQTQTLLVVCTHKSTDTWNLNVIVLHYTGWNSTHTHTHTHTHTKYICRMKQTIYSPVLPLSAHLLAHKRENNKTNKT